MFKAFLSSMVHRWSSISFFQEGDVATIDTRKGPDGKVVYRARIQRKGSPTETGIFPTRSEAKKWITITEGAIFEKRHFHVKESTKYTL
jgi:hypothetical protein